MTNHNAPTVTHILFICLGNICRSPAAQGIMQHLVDAAGQSDRIIIDSAGIGPWHIGELPDERMRRHGKVHGYTFDHRARQFSAARDFRQFDLIVTMDNENYQIITGMAHSEAQRRRVVRMADYLHEHPGTEAVPDPYYGGEKDFEWAIELLEDGCKHLLQVL